MLVAELGVLSPSEAIRSEGSHGFAFNEGTSESRTNPSP